MADSTKHPPFLSLDDIPPAARAFLRPVRWAEIPFDISDTAHFTKAQPFEIIPPEGQKGLFTGYYEPELAGSFEKTDLYRYPLYAPPHGAGTEILPTRAHIEQGALAGQGLEILWCADAVEVFFLHIQGSGLVRLPDGRAQRVGFAAKNGRPYTPIGRVLKERGFLQSPMTMQNIKGWLRTHPDQAFDIMTQNESYIFFRLLETDGPVGASGQVLQAEKSLAIDPAYWPYGLDVIVQTSDPLNPRQPLVRLMRTEDTGSAIKGPLRGDIFFGGGEEAALKAGAMAHSGRMWALLNIVAKRV